MVAHWHPDCHCVAALDGVLGQRTVAAGDHADAGLAGERVTGAGVGTARVGIRHVALEDDLAIAVDQLYVMNVGLAGQSIDGARQFVLLWRRRRSVGST